jgi:hypothetical protein
MVKARRHHFAPADDTADWRGMPVECRHCPLPRGHEIHQVPELDDEQRAAELRRTGERE